jgi:SNF2 family DNA or RNA helicase
MRICLTTECLDHQLAAADKLQRIRVGALFMDMGTGKSRTAIELVFRRREKIDRVIWFCPVSLKETVRREIIKHTGGSPEDICLVGRGMRAESVSLDALWYVIGIESMSIAVSTIRIADKIITSRSMVICDESTYIKGHRSKRTARITHIGERARYRLVLTGTPLTQGVVDLYAQMRFLSPRILGYNSWYTFARNHLEYSDRYRGLIVRAHNTEWLAAKIAPYVYQVTKDECLTLPGKLYESRWCGLTDEQWEAYGLAKEEFYNDMLVYERRYSQYQSSLPIFRLFAALQAIVCGFYGQTSLANNRTELLLDVLDSIDEFEKVVIWGKYRHCVDDICSRVGEAYGKDQVAVFHGGLSEVKRDQELSRWKDSCRFLVATQAAGGHGIDLTAAAYVVFYANGFKYAERLQAEDRNYRIGQHRPVTYIDLWADCKIEDRISAALASKGNVVEQFKQEVDKIKATGRNKFRQLVDKL